MWYLLKGNGFFFTQKIKKTQKIVSTFLKVRNFASVLKAN